MLQPPRSVQSPQDVLLNEGGRSTHPQLPAPLGRELPRVGPRCPALQRAELAFAASVGPEGGEGQAMGTCLRAPVQGGAPHHSWTEIRGESRGRGVAPKTYSMLPHDIVKS